MLNKFFVVAQPFSFLNKAQKDGADGKEQNKIPRLFFRYLVYFHDGLGELVVFDKEFLVKQIRDRADGKGFFDFLYRGEIAIADALLEGLVGYDRIGTDKIREPAKIRPNLFICGIFGIDQRKAEIALRVVKDENGSSIIISMVFEYFFGLIVLRFLAGALGQRLLRGKGANHQRVAAGKFDFAQLLAFSKIVVMVSGQIFFDFLKLPAFGAEEVDKFFRRKIADDVFKYRFGFVGHWLTSFFVRLVSTTLPFSVSRYF